MEQLASFPGPAELERLGQIPPGAREQRVALVVRWLLDSRARQSSVSKPIGPVCDRVTLARKPAKLVRLWLSVSIRSSIRPTCCARILRSWLHGLNVGSSFATPGSNRWIVSSVTAAEPSILIRRTVLSSTGPKSRQPEPVLSIDLFRSLGAHVVHTAPINSLKNLNSRSNPSSELQKRRSPCHFNDLWELPSGRKPPRVQSEFADTAHRCTRLGLSVHT